MRLSLKAVMPTNFIVFDVRNDASRSKVGMNNQFSLFRIDHKVLRVQRSMNHPRVAQSFFVFVATLGPQHRCFSIPVLV